MSKNWMKVAEDKAVTFLKFWAIRTDTRNKSYSLLITTSKKKTKKIKRAQLVD